MGSYQDGEGFVGIASGPPSLLRLASMIVDYDKTHAPGNMLESAFKWAVILESARKVVDEFDRQQKGKGHAVQEDG